MMDTKLNALRDMNIALIMDGGANGLGVIHSLSDFKDEIIIVALANSRSFAHKSKFVEHTFRYNTDQELKNLLFQINDTCKKIIPFPGSDKNFQHLIKLKEKLNRFSIFWKNEDNFLLGKEYQLEKAEQAGIDIPKSIIVANDKELKQLDIFNPPYIIKPSDGAGDRIGLFKAEITSERSVVEKWASKCFEKKQSALISEYIPGDDSCLLTFGGYAYKGQLLAHFTGRKLAQQPRYRGVSTISESYPIPELQALGASFVKTVNFTGIFQFEVKQSTANKKFYFIEFNPRNWVWGEVSTKNGTNLPYLKYKTELTNSIHKELPSNRTASAKVAYVSFKGVLINIFKDKWLGILSLLTSIFFSNRKIVFSVFKPNDLKPFFQFISVSLKVVFNKLMK